MSYFMAGLLTGGVLVFVFILYDLIRGKTLANFFKGQDESFAHLSDSVLCAIILAGFIGAAILFGIAGGLVFGLLGAPSYFTLIALGVATLLSGLAIVSKTPLTVDKIVWNFAVGGLLGVLVPAFYAL